MLVNIGVKEKQQKSKKRPCFGDVRSPGIEGPSDFRLLPSYFLFSTLDDDIGAFVRRGCSRIITGNTCSNALYSVCWAHFSCLYPSRYSFCYSYSPAPPSLSGALVRLSARAKRRFSVALGVVCSIKIGPVAYRQEFQLQTDCPTGYPGGLDCGYTYRDQHGQRISLSCSTIP